MNYDYIISEFNHQFDHLKRFGLKVHGVANLIDNYDVISISTPFIFDRTKLPCKFMGLALRDGTSEDELPIEFRNMHSDEEYIWAYQRFEDYVDAHADLIRETLENPKMTREEMLDALCFGDFNKHKELCITWEKEGKIPAYKKKSIR